jgi:apolipoprotein N-acyltransferase
VLATDARGRVVGRYDKQHLLEFAEHTPFGETLPIIYQWFPNLGRLVPGDSLEPLVIGGHPVTVLICYEAIHPAFVNRAVNYGRPELIVNATNDAWFGDTTEPWIHLSLAKLRAVEHRRYMVRATNSGVSAIIDPAGRIVAQSGTFRQETVDAVVGFMKGPRTGYEIWGDGPWWGASAVLLFMAFFAKLKGRGYTERFW